MLKNLESDQENLNTSDTKQKGQVPDIWGQKGLKAFLTSLFDCQTILLVQLLMSYSQNLCSIYY